MRGTALALVVLGTYGMCAGHGHAAEGDVTLNGSFVNIQDEKKGTVHPVKAVFTPAGEKKWTVVFTFTWYKRGAQTFKGTAEGSLQDGEVKGVVQEKRTYAFSGTAKNGQLECKHDMTENGKTSATGTMTLKKE